MLLDHATRLRRSYHSRIERTIEAYGGLAGPVTSLRVQRFDPPRPPPAGLRPRLGYGERTDVMAGEDVLASVWLEIDDLRVEIRRESALEQLSLDLGPRHPREAQP